jgi:hypothetical protein
MAASKRSPAGTDGRKVAERFTRFHKPRRRHHPNFTLLRVVLEGATL